MTRRADERRPAERRYMSAAQAVTRRRSRAVRCRTIRGLTRPIDADADRPADLDGDDRLREECGVFGIFGHPDAAALTALGLHALQHRGQEAAGIVSFDGTQFHSERQLGLVGDNFTEPRRHRAPAGPRAPSAMSATRPPARPILRNVQPLFAELDAGGFAVAHNGNLTNGLTLRRELHPRRRDLPVDLRHRGDPPSRRPLARSRASSTASSMRCARSRAPISLVALTNKKLIGARDPLGIRPLVLGELDGAYILASETCALDIIGARFVRDVENGEMVVITDDGHRSRIRPSAPQPARPCIFEYVYFARPDSVVDGRNVYEVRKRMGARAGARERRPTPTWSCRCRIPACRRRIGFAAGVRASPSSSASSATTMSAAPSSSRRSRSAQLGVQAQAHRPTAP